MKNRVVIVTDLGNFKAYKLDDSQFNSNPRLELLEQFDMIAGHQKLVEQTTDQAGRFPRGSGVPGISGDMSAGERHNIALEQRKRIIKQLAEQINALLRPGEVDGCYLAVPREINNMLLDELAPHARAKIEKNLTSDLTKTDKKEILKHFDLLR